MHKIPGSGSAERGGNFEAGSDSLMAEKRSESTLRDAQSGEKKAGCAERAASQPGD
jgi:hypothetical protein